MRKGQLLSLDLLVSLILITVSTGIVLHWTEEQSALLKEKQVQAQILQVAELATNNLVANPSVICELVETDTGAHLAYLNNCLPKRVKNITKEEMGVPEGYDCLLDDSGSGANLQSECANYSSSSSQLGSVKDYYSVKRTVVYYQASGPNKSKITRSELSSCMSGGSCSLTKGTLTMYVWSQNG